MSGQNSTHPASDGITPLQQMVASCSGAVLTSLLGETPWMQPGETSLLAVIVSVSKYCFGQVF